MVGVTADQGNVHRPSDTTPTPASTGGGTNHLKVTPENVLALAETFRSAADTLDNATQGMDQDLQLPDDAFLGDPYSKWAIQKFNDYFVDSDNSLTNTLDQLVHEHMATFNALKAAADNYGMTDEWNAKNLGEVYDLS